MPRRSERSDRDHLAALAVDAMSGDDTAFEQIHRRLNGGLSRFFLKRTQGAADIAEDLAQRTWVQAWRSLRARRYDPARAAISTFVYAIGHHVWLQHRRSAAAGPTMLSESERLFLHVESTEDDPAGILAAAELLEAVRECIRADGGPDALTGDEREVLRAFSAGVSERDLAARLGLAASTVHARKAAAIDKLRRRLSRRGLVEDGPERRGRGGE